MRTCAICKLSPDAGLILCHSEKPATAYCAVCYSAHVRNVHDGGQDDMQVEDTEAWRQINARLRRAGRPVACWMLIERPDGGAEEPDDDWECVAFVFKESEARAWHDPSVGRIARRVEVASPGSA